MSPKNWQVAKLRTQRLVLEPVTALHGRDPATLAQMFAMRGDAAVTRFLPYPPWQSTADASAWFERVLPRMALFESIIWLLRHEGEVIGDALLFGFDASDGNAEFGYEMGQAHWGKGLMTEAGHAVCQWAQGQEGLVRLHAKLDPRNTASARLVQRLGFSHEGTLRQAFSDPLSDNGRGDCALYGLLQGELKPPRCA